MTDPLTRLTAALSDRYRIERELGAGGMATVWLAHDLKHDREVAIKVLREDLSSTLGAERFLAEIRTTARLQHPHILPLMDSGSTAAEGASGGLLYYVMPYLTGETLRERLRRELQLGVEETLRIAKALAGALDFAHAAGIVHRDLKPENVLFQANEPVLADFGIALAVASAGGARLTQTGLSLGTPQYMSPEQASGERGVGVRSDVYALGAVTYEMLAGEPPHAASSMPALMAKVLTQPPVPLRVVRSGVPEQVEAAVQKALSKAAADRFGSAGAFVAALSATSERGKRPVAPSAAPPIPQRAVPLVGRVTELAPLRSHLDRLAGGQGATVLLGGEPGVGKTRLAEAVLEEAFGRGYLCLVGHCYEMEGTPSYTPVIEHLEQLSRTLPAPELRAVLGDAAPEIARFFPGLRRLVPDVGLPMELPPEQQRQYLHARFREYVERLAARGPVVVLVDDLHWADDSSLLLLEALAPNLETMPVLILGTYRDVELEIGRPFAAVLERLTRRRHADRLPVRRLPEADVGALLAALGGSPPPEGLVQAIQHETEGNPFFVEEVFAHLKEEGRLLDASGGWRADLSLAELEVPEGVKLVIGRRLARVAETTRAVLTMAAVTGPRFAPRVVEEVGGLDGDAVLDALDEAERAGLVRQLGGGREVRYGFAHELIRHTLVSGLSGPRRQRWHLKIADALEGVYAGKLEEHAADLAYHLYEAGAAAEPMRAIGALISAAQATLDAGACAEVMTHVTRAESIEPTELQQRASLLRIRSGASRGLGLWNDAVRDGEAAVHLYRDLDTVEHEVLYAHLVEMLVYSGQLPRALALVRQRRTRAEPSVTGVLLEAWSGFAEGTVGDESVADQAFADAEGLAAQLDDPYPAAVARFVRSMYLGHRGRMRESVGGFEDAATDLLSLGKDWYAAPALSHAMWALSMLGRGSAAADLEATARQVAERVGHAGAREHIEGIGKVINWARRGDISATMAGIVASEPRMRDASPSLANFSEALAFLLRFYQGDWSEPLDRLTAMSGEHKIETWNHLHDAYAFLLKSYRGEPDRREVLRKFHDRLPRPGGERVLGTWWVLKPVIEGLVVSGDRHEASGFYDAACEMVELGFIHEFTGAFETSTGLAAACSGQWDLAERHFENAMRSCEVDPHILGQGETRRWYAWMCLERGAAGDAEKALGLLDGAQRVYERIGMPKHIEMVHALRARAEQRG